MRRVIMSLLALVFAKQVIAAELAADVQPLAGDLIERRLQLEEVDIANPFVISFYKPTYVLPFYYNLKTPYLPNQANPTDNKLKNTEFKFQISFKVPLWREMFGLPSALYMAYTQHSFWQAYADSPFFRETNYEPELFLATKLDMALMKDWRLKFINLGVIHQSNGRGGALERSWNRAYTELTAANSDWMISFKPWLIIKDSSLNTHNPDIADYLGHGQLMAAYRQGDHTISMMSRNSLESHFKHGTLELTWSYPLLPKVKGYVQIFSGYGQSLIDYQHYTNAVGLGLTLNDWF